MKLSNEQKSSLAVFVKLMRATNTVTQESHGHLAECDLTQSQFAVLEALYHLGPLCQGELSNKILKSNANITSVVDALEKKSLARRDRSGEDRRKVLVELTPKGTKRIREIFPRHAEAISKTFSVLTEPEKKQLGDLLRRLGRQ